VHGCLVTQPAATAVRTRYVPLDFRIVNIASNDSDDLQETFNSPKENYIAADVCGPYPVTELRTNIADIGMLRYQPTLLAQLSNPLPRGDRFVAGYESSDLLEVVFRF